MRRFRRPLESRFDRRTAVLILDALSGVLGIAVGVVAHEGSELLAIGNGLRVNRS